MIHRTDIRIIILNQTAILEGHRSVLLIREEDLTVGSVFPDIKFERTEVLLQLVLDLSDRTIP